MMILDRARDLHDNIVHRYYPEFRRYYPDFREYAPLTFSAVFLLVLATMLGVTMLGGANGVARPEFLAGIDYPAMGAELRLSRISMRATSPIAARTYSPMDDADDPQSPMLIDIDPESGAVNASAGTIDVHGTPINIGNWPLR